MISCKVVQEIHASGRELTFWERLQYKFHLFVCSNCQKIQSQYEIIHRKIKNLPDPEITQEDQGKIDDIFKNIK